MTAASFFIIDDDLSFGKSLKRMLNARGIPAEYYGSAESFFDCIPPGQLGYAIVDLHMPDCDGLTLLGQMKQMHYAMPVIIITGLAQADARDMALQMGAIGFLQKPFSEESLLELVAKNVADRSSA
jgi:two-component system, LuxR family, response regulator FixJ